MYLHLGGDTVVLKKEIVAICDLDNTSTSYRTREFLKSAEKSGKMHAASDELPKSFVVLRDGSIYLSQLNSVTLMKRAESAGMLM